MGSITRKIFIILIVGCALFLFFFMFKYQEMNMFFSNYRAQESKEIQQEQKRQSRTSTRKKTEKGGKNRSATVSAHAAPYGELYTKVIDIAADTLTVARSEPTTSQPIGMEIYSIKPDAETKFIHQRTVQQNGRAIFSPEQGSFANIKKNWYVKLHYDPKRFFPPGSAYGHREGFVIPEEILYSEQSPFQP